MAHHTDHPTSINKVTSGTKTREPTDVTAGRGHQSVRWSGLAVIGKQASQMLCALILARLLGPASYGVIGAASIYVTMTTLFLDQGLASALVQRPALNRLIPGAVTTLNLLSGAIMAGLTVLCAPLIADFFNEDELTALLRVLGIGLLLKSIAITPRAMQLRSLGYKVIAAGEIGGGILGAIVGIAAALAGAGHWAMAWQVIITDLVAAIILQVKTRGTRPNLHLKQVKEILPFSLRIFGSNGLAFFARNSDNILVGRFLGVASLSYYSMAYRVLVIPVQMLGQTVNRVSFPTMSRVAQDRERLASIVRTATELLSMASVPPMILVAVSSPELIRVVLGSEWMPTAPVLAVLAIAGARETVFSVTGSLMRATGRGKLIMRYELFATALQLAGIVVGLQFGLLGVAIGLTVSGFCLAPVMLIVQRRLAGVKVSAQLRTILPAIHASLWGASSYLLITLIGMHPAITLIVGAIAFCVMGLGVLALFHRPALKRTIDAGLGIVGIKSRGTTSPS